MNDSEEVGFDHEIVEEIIKQNQEEQELKDYSVFDGLVPIPKKDFVVCLRCEKKLKYDEMDLVHDGGFMQVSFHYGSKNDQMDNANPREVDSPKERLLACNKIEAYICDECFDENIGLFSGFLVEKQHPKEMRII